MKDKRTERIANELIRTIDQWFAKRKSPKTKRDLAEQRPSRTKPDREQSEAPEAPTCDAMHNRETK